MCPTLLNVSSFSDLQQFLPDDVPPLESSFHLLPLPLSSQLMFYLPDNRTFGVEDSPSTPCMRVNRLKLRRILSTNVNIKWGKKLTHLEEDDEKATAFFDDGTSASGDILIGVDGTFSAGEFWFLSLFPSFFLAFCSKLHPSPTLCMPTY